jgi:rubrerythrin
MNDQNSVAGFELPAANADSKLHRILDCALEMRSTFSITSESTHFWDSKFFNLHQVKIFQSSNLQEQMTILDIVNRDLLRESYFIEQAGVGYMAKMVLLAETTEERMLYGLFTADEATHLSQIMQLLPEPQAIDSKDFFLNLIAELIETHDKTILVFVIQVVLEGWGLSHYRRLAKGCCDRAIHDLFTSFLQAESRHHSTGVTLFNQISMSTSSQKVITEILSQFLQMIQLGPQGILSAIEQVKGHLSRSQKIEILENIDTETHSGTRLKLLRSLIESAGTSAIVEKLIAQGKFEALPANQCV